LDPVVLILHEGMSGGEQQGHWPVEAHQSIHVIAGEVEVCGHRFLRSVVETLNQHPSNRPEPPPPSVPADKSSG
jgi:hypothetical protein